MNAHVFPKIARCSASSGLWWCFVPFIVITKHPLQWFLIGLNIFLIQLLAWLFLAAINAVFLIFGPITVPLIGLENFMIFQSFAASFIGMTLISSALAGIALAARVQASDIKPRVSHFWRGLKSRFFTSFGIGFVPAIFLAAITLRPYILARYTILSNPTLKHCSYGDDIDYNDPLLEPLNHGNINYLVVLCVVFLFFLIFFLPPMVALFQRAGFLKAIKCGIKATFVNFMPMLVYLLGLSLILVVFYSANLALASFGEEKNIIILLRLFLSIPIMFLLPCWLGLSAFIAYRDIFHGGDALNIAWPLNKAMEATRY
jgi:MFS family permease